MAEYKLHTQRKECMKKPSFDSVIDTLFDGQRNDIRAARYGLYAVYTFGSGDYSPKDIAQTVRGTLGVKKLKAIKTALDAINEFDDRLDLLPPEAIVKLAEGTPNDTRPLFERFGDVAPDSMREVMGDLVRNRIMTRDEINGFIDLTSQFIVQEAKHAAAYDKDHKVEDREALVEMHMRLTEVTGAFVMHMFKRDPEVTQHIRENEGVDYEFLAGKYPKLCTMCRLTQYKDDILDLYKDALGAQDTGRALPSVVMLNSEQNGTLFDENGKDFHPDYQRLCDISSPVETRLSFERLPSTVRKSVGEVVEQYKQEAAQFPPMLQSLLLNDMKHVLKDGIYITRDKDVEDTERSWHQRFTKSKAIPPLSEGRGM